MSLLLLMLVVSIGVRRSGCWLGGHLEYGSTIRGHGHSTIEFGGEEGRRVAFAMATSLMCHGAGAGVGRSLLG